MTRSILKTIGYMAAYATLHSLLATRYSKAWVARWAGEQRRDAFYRLAYNGVAAVATTALVIGLHRLPDRMLYRVRGLWRIPQEAARAACLLCLAFAVREMGIGPFSGVTEAGNFLLQGRISREPEAQGPVKTDAGLRVTGPYRYIRHPLNFAFTALLFLLTHMTDVRLTVALTSLIYSLIGSKLEEQRLLERYGLAYRRYMESGVPFFFPRLRG